MQDIYFEFLVPQTVPDARQRDPPIRVPGADKFPDLVQSASNVYVVLSIYLVFYVGQIYFFGESICCDCYNQLFSINIFFGGTVLIDLFWIVLVHAGMLGTWAGMH